MKQTYDLTRPTLLSEISGLAARGTSSLDSLARLGRKVIEWIPERRQLLKTGGATLLISCLFLAGSYLFLIQLAKYGW